MDVHTTIQNAKQLLGQLIEVSGYILSGSTTALHASDDPSSASIALPHPELQELLLNHVPVYLGGNFAYRDACLVKGVLQASEGQLKIEPTALTITSDGESYHVSIPAST